MAKGRSQLEWGQTAQVLATITNSNPFRKGKPVSAAEFNPTLDAARAKPQRQVVPLKSLRGLFVPQP